VSIQEIIKRKLFEAFSPWHLEVINESHNHSVPAGSESHFKVVIVTDSFDGQRLLSRHRAINRVLAEELQHAIHALALHTYTESEWHNLDQGIPVSPLCRGGSRKG